MEDGGARRTLRHVRTMRHASEVLRGASLWLLPLLFITALRTVSALALEKYPTLSLADLCAKKAVEGALMPPITLNATSAHRAAVIFILGPTDTEMSSVGACSLHLVAPEQHVLSFSYLRSETSTYSAVACPIPLTFEGNTMENSASRTSLCEEPGQANLPRLLSRQGVLHVDIPQFWPLEQHGLLFTAVATDMKICLNKNQFPCKMEPHSKYGSKIVPSMCIHEDFQCDGLDNCPMSASDEAPGLCKFPVTPTMLWVLEGSTQATADRILNKHVKEGVIRAVMQLTSKEKAREVQLRMSETSVSLSSTPPARTNEPPFWFYSVTIATLLVLVFLVLLAYAFRRRCPEDTGQLGRPGSDLWALRDFEQTASCSWRPARHEVTLQETVVHQEQQVEQELPPSYATLFPHAVTTVTKDTAPCALNEFALTDDHRCQESLDQQYIIHTRTE